MKIKVSELSVPQLNYAVALCEGESDDFLARKKTYPSLTEGAANDWSQGGPIIERENINWLIYTDGYYAGPTFDQGTIEDRGIHGPTPLIAAMRCYVASKLGNEVEISDELLSSTN